MADTERRALAKEEYFYLQGAYERFDSAFFQIKSWSVTLGAAGLLAALNLESNQPLAFLMIGGMAVIFWYMDSTWKTFQRAHLPRIEALEAVLQQEDSAVPVPGIRLSWKSTFDTMRGLKSDGPPFPGVNWIAPNVSVPHIAILLVAVTLAVVSALGWLQGDPEPPPAAISIAQSG